MIDDLRELYQELIVEHSSRPRNCTRPAGANRSAKGHNPLCGDQVEVYLVLEDGLVKDVGFQGKGCAISLASASLMTEALKGKSVDEVRALFERFRRLVTGKDDSTAPDLDRLMALSGVRSFPVRVKCATLPWYALVAALEGDADRVTTD
ncbi:MAG: Fe-S cluster assembly sulfur transfer protein SufU [Alphaproteobacteria bacterium]